MAGRWRPRRVAGRYSFKLPLRWALAISALCLALYALYSAVNYKKANVDPQKIFRPIAFNDPVKAAMDVKTHESETLLTLSLVVIGGLLAMLFAKPDEARTVNGHPELLMFFCALFLLIVSMLCHERYTDAVADSYLAAHPDRYATSIAGGQYDAVRKDTKIDAVVAGPAPALIESKLTVMDIRDPSIEYLLQNQFLFLILGIVVSGLTLFCARFLKEEKADGSLYIPDVPDIYLLCGVRRDLGGRGSQKDGRDTRER